MSEVGNDWKNLRPQIGNLISKIDSLVQGSENIENLKKKAEDKGYERGLAEVRKDFCNDCPMIDFYTKCNGHYRIIDVYLQLSVENKQLINNLIDRLAKMEGIK